MNMMGQDVKDNPGQAKKYDDVEKHTKDYVDKLAAEGPQATAAASITVTIPVAVHVLWNKAQHQPNPDSVVNRVE